MNTLLSCKDQNMPNVSNPLSKIRNWSPDFVIWYLSGNTGIPFLCGGVGGKSLSFHCEWIVRFRLLIYGRLTAAVSEIFWRAASKICWGVSCVASDLRFIDAFIFFDLNLILRWWVGVLVNLPDKFNIHMKLYFCFTLPFLPQCTFPALKIIW